MDLIGERRPHVHGGGEQRKRTGGREEEGPLAGLQPMSILARIPSPPTSMRPVATGFPVHPSRQSSSLLAFTASSAVQSSASEERRPTPAAWDAILGHAMCGPQCEPCGSSDVCVWLALTSKVMKTTLGQRYSASSVACSLLPAAPSEIASQSIFQARAAYRLPMCGGTKASEKSSNDGHKCNGQSHLVVT